MPSNQLTSSTDVAGAMVRPLTDDEDEVIDTLIAAASSRLRARRPAIDDRIALWNQDPRPSTAIDPDVVASVLAGVIKRVLVNPRGLWSASESEGPFASSETYPGARGGSEAASSPGGLAITDDDLVEIFGRRMPRAGTIHVRAGLPGARSR